MTSGIPFSRQEIDYVKQHSPNEFPSIIARGLSVAFNEYNKGKRSKEGVAILMRAIRDGTLEPDQLQDDPVKEEEPVPEPKEVKPLPDLRKGRKVNKKAKPI